MLHDVLTRIRSEARRPNVPGFLVVLTMMICGVALADPSSPDETPLPSAPDAAEPTTLSSIPGLQFSRPLGASGWARVGRRISPATPHLVDTGSLNYRTFPGRAPIYPRGGVRTTDGLHLSPALARLYGVRHVELGRGGTALKGAGLGGKIALLTGAMASSFGWVDEKTALWMAGGAAVVGSFYGLTVGYEQTSWREEWRWPQERRDDGP